MNLTSTINNILQPLNETQPQATLLEKTITRLMSPPPKLTLQIPPPPSLTPTSKSPLTNPLLPEATYLNARWPPSSPADPHRSMSPAEQLELELIETELNDGLRRYSDARLPWAERTTRRVERYGGRLWVDEKGDDREGNGEKEWVWVDVQEEKREEELRLRRGRGRGKGRMKERWVLVEAADAVEGDEGEGEGEWTVM